MFFAVRPFNKAERIERGVSAFLPLPPTFIQYQHTKQTNYALYCGGVIEQFHTANDNTILIILISSPDQSSAVDWA